MCANVVRVKKIRELKGWDQAQLAAASGLSLRTIAHIESGRAVRISTLARVVSALGVTHGDLYDMEDVNIGEASRRARSRKRVQFTLHMHGHLAELSESEVVELVSRAISSAVGDVPEIILNDIQDGSIIVSVLAEEYIGIALIISSYFDPAWKEVGDIRCSRAEPMLFDLSNLENLCSPSGELESSDASPRKLLAPFYTMLEGLSETERANIYAHSIVELLGMSINLQAIVNRAASPNIDLAQEVLTEGLLAKVAIDKSTGHSIRRNQLNLVRSIEEMRAPVDNYFGSLHTKYWKRVNLFSLAKSVAFLDEVLFAISANSGDDSRTSSPNETQKI